MNNFYFLNSIKMSKQITGTDYYEAVQEVLNSGISIVNELGKTEWTMLDKIIGCSDELIVDINIDLTEYRRLYSLFESLGADMNDFSETVFIACEFVDFEMVSEWMRYKQNKKLDFDSDEMPIMNYYAEKFDYDVRDMFKFIYNDDDGEYLKRISEFLMNYPDYPTYFCDDLLYPDSGRMFQIMSEDVEEYIAGKLIRND